MRTPRTKIRRPRADTHGLGEHGLVLAQPAQALGQAVDMAMERQDALANRYGDLVGLKHTFDRKQPFALLVPFADEHRLVGRSVKVLTDLGLEQGPLFFDHDDHVEAVGKISKVNPIKRPHTPHLEQAHTQPISHRLVNAEVIKRLPRVEIALAGGDDADARIPATAIDDLVEAVFEHEGCCGTALVFMQPGFLPQKIDLRPNVDPILRQVDLGQVDLHPVDAAIHRGSGFHIVLDAFERHPIAGEARQGIAIKPVIEDFLHAGRVQDRHHHVQEKKFGLVRIGRAFRAMIIAHECQHTAMTCGSRKICVAEYVTRPVYARTLAIPQAEHAILGRRCIETGLLRAPDRRGRKFLIEAGLEDDVFAFQRIARTPQLMIKPAKRRAAISGNEAAGIKSGKPVTLFLHEQHAHDCLGAGYEDPFLGEVELVVE